MSPQEKLYNPLGPAGGESPDEWYEREKAAFRAWWESDGRKETYSETPTMAAGAGWLGRAEAASSWGDTTDNACIECSLSGRAACPEHGAPFDYERVLVELQEAESALRAFLAVDLSPAPYLNADEATLDARMRSETFEGIRYGRHKDACDRALTGYALPGLDTATVKKVA